MDLEGKVVWECYVPAPEGLSGKACGCASRVSDAEFLPDGNVLVLSGGEGTFEGHEKPLRREELNTEAPLFNADRRGLADYHGT